MFSTLNETQHFIYWLWNFLNCQFKMQNASMSLSCYPSSLVFVLAQEAEGYHKKTSLTDLLFSHHSPVFLPHIPHRHFIPVSSAFCWVDETESIATLTPLFSLLHFPHHPFLRSFIFLSILQTFSISITYLYLTGFLFSLMRHIELNINVPDCTI